MDRKEMETVYDPFESVGQYSHVRQDETFQIFVGDVTTPALNFG